MELLLKALVLTVVIIVIAGIGFYLFQKSTVKPLTSSGAVQLVVNDLKAKNPSANITVISVSNSTLQKNSWGVILSVVYNATRACPTLLIEAFDYPATGLVPGLANLYTSNCIVYGLSNAPSYVISSPAIAQAESYMSNNTMIRNYVKIYGYNNTVVTAQFVKSANNTIAPGLVNVWLVKYRAAIARYSEYAVLSPSGSVIQVYNTSS